MEKAKALEDTFIDRFETAVKIVSRLACPLDGRNYPAGTRDRTILRRNQGPRVIELMRRNRIYDRALLDRLPLDESCECRVFTRSLFGRRETKVAVVARAMSPVESFLAKRETHDPLGPIDLERGLADIVREPTTFYYVGVLATVGWKSEVRDLLHGESNYLVCLVENRSGTEWARAYLPDERWQGLDKLFDPETEREKVERVKVCLKSHPELRPKGGHVILHMVVEDLSVPESIVRAAVDQVLEEDDELTLLNVGGKDIVKRNRLS